MFPKLCSRNEYLAVQQRGKSIATKTFIVRYLKKSKALSRVGLTVSKRIGGAVLRNRLKRRIRETIRLNPLPWSDFNYDLVIIPKKNAGLVPFSQLVEEWISICAILQNSQAI